MRDGEFLDPLLVPGYDAECRWGPDDDFFLAVVNETPAARVLDLGCGTGRLTLALAAAGHTVTGVDPAGPSLATARRKPGADRVTWVQGTSRALPDRAYDVALLTSHVAQVFGSDDEWNRTLADLARALVPGGRLAFDSRDPAHRAWERWNPVDSRRLIRLPDGRPVRAWTEVTGVRDGGAVVSAVVLCGALVVGCGGLFALFGPANYFGCGTERPGGITAADLVELYRFDRV
ncbi:class I SAM-dependent methyltransferase [Micromonospora olivasterospora]|uniref:Methyltransferase family protein n=1 Tax=Micromonospora olivasterospora TaxID=1880 RepID=A0A562I631_MICOL|nr:class I SAM-dependent methyltransferase [Micromonospora olivasterospora]TWH66469.1 methyltransferase family protein [Micromonospora olivasterospora]